MSTEVKDKVETVYNEVLRQFDRYTNADEVEDIDAMGNKIWKDKSRPVRNYWGWDISKLEQTKEVQRRAREAATGYGNVPMYPLPGQAVQEDVSVEDAVARARSLAAERGRVRGGRGGERGGRGFGRGFGRGGRR